MVLFGLLWFVQEMCHQLTNHETMYPQEIIASTDSASLPDYDGNTSAIITNPSYRRSATKA